MTLDEAIEEIKTNIKVKWMCGDDYSPMMIEALRVLIKHAKLNAKVFEDIKAEIRKMPNRNPSYTHTCDVVDREDVLDIIDKHISGKEQG